MARAYAHQPVLLSESLEQLILRPGSVVVDGTLGGGGHAVHILEKIGPDGRLIGMDLDPQALEAAATRLSRKGALDSRVQLVHRSFREVDVALRELGIDCADGVLLDLGVSSHQLDTPERGFRFARDAAEQTPLDMRMNPEAGASAAELLRRASLEDLERWFREYAQLPRPRRLARAIIARREQFPYETSADLLETIRAVGAGGGRRHDPATLIFQALRIAVNDELGALQAGLDAAIRVLRPGGRLVVIAYHSLEDRIVKHLFRAAARGCNCPPKTPVCVCGGEVTLVVLTRRPVRPGPEEVLRNPRARSARLRAAERVGREAA